MLEKSYKSKDWAGYEKELKVCEKQLEKCNKLISSLYQDYRNEIIQEYDFKTMYDQEIANRERISEKIANIKQKINNKVVISDVEFKRIAKKVSDVKKWTKEQLADVIDSVEIDNEDNIFINMRWWSDNVILQCDEKIVTRYFFHEKNYLVTENINFMSEKL